MPRNPTAPAATAAPTITEAEAAVYIGMSREYLRAARNGRGRPGPDYVRAGRAIRYRVAALDRWLDEHTVRSTPRVRTSRVR